MFHILKKHWPLSVSLTMFYISIIILFIISINRNQGHFVYAIDDPYIHMAIARNFAHYGIWGINKDEFASSSSSLLWTFLLSIDYFFFGENEISPFILNFIFANFVIITIYFILKQYTSESIFIFVVLFFVVYATPLVALIFSGMEHIMHILFTILLVYFFIRVFSKKDFNIKELILVLILSLLINATRYESLFLIFILNILLILRKRFLHAFYIGDASIVPIIIFGIISVWNGWYFLPSTILLKGNMPDSHNLKFFYSAFSEILMNPHIFFLMICVFTIFIFQYMKKDRQKDIIDMMVIFLAVTFLHIQFAKTGWFFRYEAYLVTLGILVIAISISKYLSREKLSHTDYKYPLPWYVKINLFLLIIILGIRILFSLIFIPIATTNIYEQQYQMGLFLKKYYQGETIAANDIGAINYLADIKTIDLFGLASLEVAKWKLEGRYNSERMYQLAKQKKVRIAIIYDHWFKKIPSEWIKVGEWTISNNVICGGDTVSFYAVDPLEKYQLSRNLKSFSTSLPRGVLQSFYIESDGENNEKKQKAYSYLDRNIF